MFNSFEPYTQLSAKSTNSSTGYGSISSFLLTEISIEFNQRIILLYHGYLKVSRDPNDYPIHKAIFDGVLDQIIDLSFTDKATLTSLKLFGVEVDPLGNTPLKLAVRIGDYDAVRSLLKSGCAEPLMKPQPSLLQQSSTITNPNPPQSATFSYSAYELACLIGDEQTVKHFIEDKDRRKRHAWKGNLE